MSQRTAAISSRRTGRASISRGGLVDWVRLAVEQEIEESTRATRQRDESVEHPKHFRYYVERTNPSLFEFEHIPTLVDVGERIITGELRNVMVLMPTRYLKTEVFGRLLTGAFLERYPSWKVGLTSYGADLAWATSEEARANFQMAGGKLARDTTAKKRWGVIGGGEMWAAGVGGPLLGFGYHLGVIDDPASLEHAGSPRFQQRFEDWFPGKFLSRREPGARVVIDMQRLGVNDPIDFLFRREVGEDTDLAPMYWHVVALQEILDDRPLGRWSGPRGLPPTCTLEPDYRTKLGMVLAPSRFDAGTVRMMQETSGPYVTAAQRQQAPQAAVGDFWHESDFETYDVLPLDAYEIGWDWDLAYTDDDRNSASAGIRSAKRREPDGSISVYVDDVLWDWVEFPEAVEMIVGTGKGPHYVEAKASGKSVVQALRASPNNVPAKEVAVKGDKFMRATLAQPIVKQGRVFVRRGKLRELLHGPRQGLLHVTAEALADGRGDLDVNDAFVQAIHRHVDLFGKKAAFESF